MRVLVTGAGGFAGGHIARRLAEAGFEVFALTRRSVVEPPVDVSVARRFHPVTGALESADLPGDLDAVVHAAATSIWTGISVDAMLTDNVVATQAVVRHAIRSGARALVFLSSVSAFGAVGVPILDEGTPSVGVDAYGATKLLGEHLLADVAGDLPSLSIRLPAVIGRGSKRNWPSEVLRKLAAGLPLDAFNPNARFNNVLHERDLCALIESALKTGLVGADMVVAASADEIQVRDVVRLIADGTASSSTIAWSERERPAFLIDSAKAIELYGYRPMSVDEALAAYVADSLIS